MQRNIYTVCYVGIQTLDLQGFLSLTAFPPPSERLFLKFSVKSLLDSPFLCIFASSCGRIRRKAVRKPLDQESVSVFILYTEIGKISGNKGMNVMEPQPVCSSNACGSPPCSDCIYGGGNDVTFHFCLWCLPIPGVR